MELPLRLRSTPLLLGAALLGAPLLAAQTQVHVVDAGNGPGTDFTDLQLAINTAQDGDVLLVRSGFYSKAPFGGDTWNVVDKGISIVAESGANVTMGPFIIGILSANKQFTMRGFTMLDGAQVSVVDCEGPVTIEDCHFSININGAATAISASGSSAVNLNRVTSSCAQWVGSPGVQVARVSATDSNLAMYDCQIEACDSNPFAPTAMSAVSITGGTLFVSGSELLGGDGCSGSGLLMDGAAPFAQIVDSTIQAGFCTSGTPDIDPKSGSFVLLPNDAKSFEVDSPVRPGESVTLRFDGEPGDFIWLDIGLFPGAMQWPFTTGIWQISFASYYDTIFYGTLPPTGSTVIQIPLGPLQNPGQLWLQGDFLDPSNGRLTLSGGSHLLLVP